ncbi:MAG: glycosyltransferase family 4 protein [Planctomycetota bacterium]
MSRFALAFPAFHRRGGVERILVEVAHDLVAHDHEVHLFGHDFDADTLPEGAVVHAIAGNDPLGLMRTLRFADRSRAAIDATGLAFDRVATCGVLAPAGSVIWAQSVHAAWLEIGRRDGSLKDRLMRRLNPFHPAILRRERAVFGGRQYAHVVALTDRVKVDLMRFYGVPADDITVIPNGFAPGEFNPSNRAEKRDAMRRSLGITDDERAVVFVANEAKRKGLIPLMKAIAQINDARLKLLAVGRLDAVSLSKTADELGLAGRVTFTGPSPTVADYYAAADAFALPTIYEAWGLVIVEAMACGVPALTSRLAGAAAAVQPEVNGDLLDDPADIDEIADKLGGLLDRPHDPQAVSASVQPYRWDRVLRRFEQVLLDPPSPSVDPAVPAAAPAQPAHAQPQPA